MWGPFLRDVPYEDTSLQNSVLLHGLCNRACEPQFSYTDAVTTYLLHVLLLPKIESVA
jgi:hypothetical protein